MSKRGTLMAACIVAIALASSCGLFVRNPECPDWVGHDCLPNPCGDGLYCNGVESCAMDGACPVCSPGTPIECDPGYVCDEGQTACVAVADKT